MSKYICERCKNEVDCICYDKENKTICADCIRNAASDGDYTEYCASCGHVAGLTSYNGSNYLKAAFYLNIQSVQGKGIGTSVICANCVDKIPDRMGYYTQKMKECINRFEEEQKMN